MAYYRKLWFLIICNVFANMLGLCRCRWTSLMIPMSRPILLAIAPEIDSDAVVHPVDIAPEIDSHAVVCVVVIAREINDKK